ncbi:MAG TPA: MFS transporter [Stellaceae bacterium]|nr:MFS transporter [Stellaceae bacterium]
MMNFFRNRWWVVVASMSGLLVGSGAVNVFALGVFLKPVTQDLHVGRGYFASGILLSSILTALGCFFIGYFLDRFGTRRVMIPGVLLYAAATAGYSMLTASPFVLYALFLATGLVGVIGSPVPYGCAVAKWFDARRGLALGISQAGVGLGVAIVPKIAERLILHFGWRAGFLGMGVTILVFAFIPIALFLRDPSPQDRARISDVAPAGNLPGISATQAFRGAWRFWALCLVFFLAVTSINGTLTHVVPYLTDRGISIQTATSALSLAGIALLLGRAFSGWCVDRFFAPYVAIVFFLFPMGGVALLASGWGGAAPIVGTVCLGLAIGAEADLLAYFVSRYFGLKDYAKIYGTMFGIFAIAAGFGPWLGGTIYDHFHSYMPLFAFDEVAILVICALLLPLGPYAYPAPGQSPRGARLRATA